MLYLIVDDEEALRRAAVRLLRRLGHETVDVGSVAEAIAVIDGPDVPEGVLCDVMMPGGTGADLHRWVADHHPTLLPRFTFMTGGIPDHEVKRYVCGCGAFVLEKPFTSDEFREALKA